MAMNPKIKDKALLFLLINPKTHNLISAMKYHASQPLISNNKMNTINLNAFTKACRKYNLDNSKPKPVFSKSNF